MLCALTVRQLKPGSFDDFVEAFRPEGFPDQAPAGWLRFDLLRDTADENRVVTFGFFDGTREELEASQAGHGYEQRRDAANVYVEAVPVNGVFEIAYEALAETA
jgi:hypothetical protein